MDNVLQIRHNDKWPKVDFNANTGILSISGKSIPSDVFLVYNPILNWLKEYVNNPPNATVLTVNLQYYNTSSSKYLLDIFKLLHKISSNGKTVTIYWVCDTEDDDLREEGEMFKSLIDVPFYLVNA